MRSSCLFGFSAISLDDAAQQLQQVLGKDAVEHESMYRGVYYSFQSSQDSPEEFILQLNEDPLGEGDERWLEIEHKDFGVLLYVNCTERANDIEDIIISAVDGAALLSRKDDVKGCT